MQPILIALLRIPVVTVASVIDRQTEITAHTVAPNMAVVSVALVRRSFRYAAAA